MLAYLLLVRVRGYHQLSAAWLLCFTVHFRLGLFLMIFLAKGKYALVRFSGRNNLLRWTLVLSAGVLKKSRLILRHHYPLPGLLLLSSPTSRFCLLLSSELFCLELRYTSSLVVELSLFDHFAHHYSLSLHDTYLKLHIVKLCVETETF